MRGSSLPPAEASKQRARGHLALPRGISPRVARRVHAPAAQDILLRESSSVYGLVARDATSGTTHRRRRRRARHPPLRRRLPPPRRRRSLPPPRRRRCRLSRLRPPCPPSPTTAAPSPPLQLHRLCRWHARGAATPPPPPLPPPVTAATRLPARPPFTCSMQLSQLYVTGGPPSGAACGTCREGGTLPIYYAPTYHVPFCGPPVSGSRLGAHHIPGCQRHSLHVPAWVFSSTWDCASVPDLCVEL